ncbi:MAG: putative baseplate assembly protein [Sphingobacteriaceae bacterium]|nr:MAG: putative baseplate assembly protein [Sphingobacteriaceae bacterium]
MQFHCCSEIRRNAVKAHPTLNGIDFLEVYDNVLDDDELRQTTLFIHFLKPLIPGSILKTNFKIEGGERIKGIKVLKAKSVVVASPLIADPRVLQLRVNKAGDFSTYKLTLIKDADHPEPPANFDNILSLIDFSFKVLCDSPFDCMQETSCEKLPQPVPDINYLAKDYSSFRQLMIDRMSLLVPGWTERNAADPGIALIELLAYAGDYLSYQQDAIATEAYLNTCRKRISLRRHARLIDYFINDGCNARTWLQISVSDDLNEYHFSAGEGTNKTKFINSMPDVPTVLSIDNPQFEQAVYEGAKVFEMLHDVTLYSSHNTITFYTWGEEECCLPKGATAASLAGRYPHLNVGDILILAEVLGPKTGIVGDADARHRHPVRLTAVTAVHDMLFNGTQPVTEITWNVMDALPFSLCISARVNSDYIPNVSVALGNILLADHGITYTDTNESSLYPQRVPLAKIPVSDQQTDRCKHEEAELILPRYRPHLKQGPLTFSIKYDFTDKSTPAKFLTGKLQGIVSPCITLNEFGEPDVPIVTAQWFPQRDLLQSNAEIKEFVVEMEADGIAHLRFGDGVLGARPKAGAVFTANYRIGNGTAGNIGADVLTHIATNDAAILQNKAAILKITNLLPARGGVNPETMEEVKLKAPKTFRVQERAVLPTDYEEMAKRSMPDIQRAAATSRWTGSWLTNFVSVDRIGGYDVDEAYETDLRTGLERYRMAGVDLEVDGPIYVSLDIKVIACIADTYFESDVLAALLKVFSNKTQPNGQKGVFHPDNFTFGQTVYLSNIYAAAQAVPGVLSVNVVKFQRQGEPLTDAIDSGKLLINRLEIARLDNNPNFRERGLFEITVIGGKK